VFAIAINDVFGPIVFAALYALPVIVAWYIIYSAVLAALRKHDRDRLVR
jgi:hypothetical protein